MKNLNKLAMGILVGALAIGFSAFKNTDNIATQKWSVNNSFAPGAKIYLGPDNVTGQTQGVQYLCTSSSQRCTVQGDSSNLHTDANGTYFNATDATVINGTFSLVE